MSASREFVSVGSEVLFGEDSSARAHECDVCGQHVADDDDEAHDEARDVRASDDGDGTRARDAQPHDTQAESPHAVAGHGLYIWARGDEIRREEPPLCPSCATALGLTALARWEIEEEEG